MRILKILYILISICQILSAIEQNSTVFERDDIRNIAARDIYDLISKVSDINASGYGITGQPVMFKRAGKLSNGIELYIDGIYFGRTVNDLSFISIDQISRIEIGRVSGSSGGLLIKINTLSYDSGMPASEVTYRDAFFNYRNLSANIYQNFSKDHSFQISGEFFDWKDKREQSDDFRYPFKKQNFRFRLNFPEYSLTRPGFDAQYYNEDKFLLDSDSSNVFLSGLRTSVFFDNSSKNAYSNRLMLTHELDAVKMKTVMLNVYDSFFMGDSLNQFEITPGITAQNNMKTLLYLRPEYRFRTFVEASLGGYAGYYDENNKTLSAHTEFGRKFASSLYFNTSHGYFFNESEGFSDPEEFFENYISGGKKFIYRNLTHDLGAGYDIISYINRPYGMPFDQWEPQREYLRLKYHLNFSGRVKFKWDYTASLNKNIFDGIVYKNITQADFSESYFNGKLHINIAVQHVYSEFFIDKMNEIMNNLSFNLRARIVDLELFFGSDNFLKRYYSFSDKTFSANEHYSYETVEGFEMRRHDEIWGVRWTFYR